MEKFKIALGADHAGFELKEKILNHLKLKGFEVKDFGTFTNESCDYPDFAKKVAEEVSKGVFDRGILICGSGIGMSISANKVKGIRAALCWNLETAESSRAHNNSNILCLAQRQVDSGLALEIVNKWIETAFEGGRHKVRIDKIEK